MKKVKYALSFALVFTLLSGVCFWGGIMLTMKMAPLPLGPAFTDLFSFLPILGIAAFIAGFFQAILTLPLGRIHPRCFAFISFLCALVFGGFFSFFAIWFIWVLVSVFNFMLIFFWARAYGN